MNIEVLRAAVRVCGKVALTAAVASCGGRFATDASGSPATSGPEQDSALAELDAAAPTASAEPVLSCNAPAASSLLPESAHPMAVVDDATFQCCAQSLSDLDSDAGPSFDTPDAGRVGPELLDCCVAIIARLDSDQRGASSPDAGAAASDQLTQDRAIARGQQATCCSPYVLGTLYREAIGPTCSPWGPPMPPGMPGEAGQPAAEGASC